ncbi:hypothetical protein DUNSADRAFT_13176 [Dunaliella salina]|uniref:Protein kinase domain-containing protein n=1 Tax=Dunaliella salina TaxID=3046 RepID=A0ABQ7G9V4_DUNSA|nr:hypothetical protein DUNSADRAFT_13176 [Dunaliella salina]|eukprot:KAF5831386.1 hypothetical protein DUNSADRAFT_13176 [Dunaliella salina]
MVLCGTLFACFGGSKGGAAKDVTPNNQSQAKGQTNQLDEVHGGLDQKDLKKPCDAPSTPERPPPSKPSSSSRATPRREEAEEPPSAPKSLAQQDQALRAILDQARRLVQEAATATAITLGPGASSQKQSGQASENEGPDMETETQLIKSQLLALSSAFRPGPDIYVRIREQLCAAREWLQSSPAPHLAASTFMRIAGDTLLQVEDSIQSAGQVPFWTPDVVAAFVELLRLYAALVHCATLMPSADASSSDGRASGRKGSSKALLGLMAQLLLGRPELLGLVGQVLELLHFSEGYRRTWGVASSTASALMLWELVHKLVRFAASLGSTARAASSPPTSNSATHATTAALPSSLPPATPSKPQVQEAGTIASSAATEGSNVGVGVKGGSDGGSGGAKGGNSGAGTAARRPSACTGGPATPDASAGDVSVSTKSGAALKSLAALLQPGKGVAARLLAQPFERGGANGAAGHLAALRLLKQAVGAWGAQLMESPGLATHYVSQHQARFMHYYTRAEGDAESASAELCRMHLKVLNVLVCTESSQVRMAMLQSQTAVALLQEFSLEAGVLCLEQQAEEEEADAAAEAEAEAAAEAAAGTGKDPGNPDGSDHAGSADEVCHSNGSDSCSSCSDSGSSDGDEGGEGGLDGGREGHGKRAGEEGDAEAVVPPSAASSPPAAAAAAAAEPGQQVPQQGGGPRRELFSREKQRETVQFGESQESAMAPAVVMRPLSLPPRPPPTEAPQPSHANSSSRSHRRSNSSSSRRGRSSSRNGDGSQAGGSSRSSASHTKDGAELQGKQGERNGSGEEVCGGGGAAGKAGPAAFSFTYDLEEDFERLMALEEALGRPVELEGLEYDEEAQALLAGGLTEPPPCPPIPESPAIEAEEVAGAAQSRHTSKAGNTPLSKEASATGSQQNLLHGTSPPSKEASAIGNQQNQALEAGSAFAQSPPSFSVPALTIPSRTGSTPPLAADHQNTPSPSVPSHVPRSIPEPGPRASDTASARATPSHTGLPQQSPPSNMCTASTSVPPPSHHSPGLSSQVSPGGIHMSPNSQAEWNQSGQPTPSPRSQPQPHLDQPQGSPPSHQHPHPHLPDAPLQQKAARQPSFWRGAAKANHQHQQHQQHQHQHPQQPSAAFQADASTPSSPSVPPHAHLMPELKGLRLGKGSYKWGEGHDTGEASSDDEGGNSSPDSSYPASPTMGNGTAGGNKGPSRVSFDMPTSPSAGVTAAGEISCMPGSRSGNLHHNSDSCKTRSSIASRVSFDRKVQSNTRGHVSLDLTLPRRKSNTSGRVTPSTVHSPPVSNRLHHSHISPLSARDPPPNTQPHLSGRPGAALQQLSARSSGKPLSPLRSPGAPPEGLPPRAPATGGPPSMPKVPSLNLEKAVAAQHPSSSRRGLHTPSGTDYARRGAGTDSSRASKSLVRGSNSSRRSTPRRSKGQQPKVAGAGKDVEGASCGRGTDEEEDGQDTAPQLSYRSMVAHKLWFNDRALHSAMLQLLLRLLVTPQGALDAAYIQAVPACEDASLPPVEHLLSWHFAGPPGAAIVADVARSLTHSLIQATSSSDRKDSYTGKSSKSSKNGKESNSKKAQGQANQLRSMLLLLRLLTRQAMDCSRYEDLHFHSRGAYGNIYSARQQRPGAEGAPPAEVMVKVIEMPPGGERCVLPEVFGEVAIMARYAQQPLPPLPGADEAQADAAQAEARGKRSSTGGSGSQSGSQQQQQQHQHQQHKQQQQQQPQRHGGWGMAKGNPGVCQLLDVGLVPDAYWIVMPKYRCSLAQWRASPQQQPPCQPRAAALYLAVLIQVVETLQVLAADSIVHYDLKAANVLVDLLPGATDEQLYVAVLQQAVWCVRPSPSPPHSTLDHLCGSCRAACCVVLSGSMLFGGLDYASVTHRVAFGQGPNLRLTRQERAALGEDLQRTDRAGVADTDAPAARTPRTAAAVAACSDADTDVVRPVGKAQQNEAAQEGSSGEGGNGAMVRSVGWPGGHSGDFVEWVLARDPANRPSWEQVLGRLQQLRGHVLSLC